MAEIDNISKIIKEISPYYKDKDGASEQHKIVYQSSSETLEPIYFWVLDKMNDFHEGNVEKLVDNFTSTPGSGHFSELMGKATRMQEQAIKILGQANTVIKSILNIIYDLKEFEMRLHHYELAKSDDEMKKESGLLSLKSIWMDNVDIKRGRGAINMLAQQLNFVTLRDAFMAAKSVKSVSEMDLNDRVKRILTPRLEEFFEWKKRSETELQKRYEIEKTYLKSQVSSLKLYTRWAKPYLKASADLEQKEQGRNPSSVKSFNTILLELTLLGKSQAKPESGISSGIIPESFEKKYNKMREYYSCVLVDFYFRGIPQRAGQHYVFGGRAEVTFKAYSLNEQELKKLDEKLDESDLKQALNLVQGVTDESLEQLHEDIEHYLDENSDKEKQEKESSKEDINPFAALIGLGKKQEKEKKQDNQEKIDKIKKDKFEEEFLRKMGEQTAKETCFKIFDIYKKAHGMQSHPDPYA